MMLEEYAKFYDAQTNLLAVMDKMTAAVEQMETAISGAVSQMTSLLKMTQKTDAVTSNLKNPMENILKSLSGKGIGDQVNWKELLTPQNLGISLAIGIGWQLFGDDIMTILTPAMGVLESFAGMVHGLLVAVAPVFSPVVWVLGQVAQMLDYMAANMGAIIPMALGIAGAIAFWNAKMIASTVVGWANTAAMWAQTTAANAQKVATGLLSGAQRVLNTVMNASPMMKILGVVMLVAGVLTMLTEKTGSLKNAWATLVNKFIDFYNFVANGLNKLFGKNIELKTHMAMDPVPEKEKEKSAGEGALTLPYNPPQTTMPELSMPVSYETDYSAMMPEMPDYSAMTPQMPDYGARLNGAALSADPLRVETVETLEGVTGAVTVSEETMAGMGLLMEEHRPEITVAPNIVINATVREEADIRKIVAAIGQHLDEECRANATGIYIGARGRTAAC